MARIQAAAKVVAPDRCWAKEIAQQGLSGKLLESHLMGRVGTLCPVLPSMSARPSSGARNLTLTPLAQAA